jgi:hypothetical protein
VQCVDDYGMNVTGTSLGHDLTAVLDDNVLETIVLNDFYESEQDNAKQRKSAVSLAQASTPGRHRFEGLRVIDYPQIQHFLADVSLRST